MYFSLKQESESERKETKTTNSSWFENTMLCKLFEGRKKSELKSCVWLRCLSSYSGGSERFPLYCPFFDG